MFIVADSGSTKTNWLVIEDEVVDEFTSSGINPHIQTEQEIRACFKEELTGKISQLTLDNIYFYGAGCSNDHNCNKVKVALEDVVKSSISVEHDLTAAGRALFLDQKGIACILGTGSNSGVYDGRDIVENIPALGYALGDEGSGAHFGKLFIRDLMYGICPKTYASEFFEEFKLDKVGILYAVYQTPRPNVFLARVGSFVSTRSCDQYFYNLISNSFDEFIKYHIVPYQKDQEYLIGVVGSIAYYNKEILMEVARNNNIQFMLIIQSPVHRLGEYHLKIRQ
jgi:N-acetylglucosamine kinase-like BadF-type ATPase